MILALDGNSLTYRAFFALPEDMKTASGQTTNAVYGFTTMLLSLVKEHKPEGIVVAFDRPEPTFRHEAVPEYKAQREKAPETLREQMGVVRELLDVLGITWVEQPGIEGDDIIATIAERAKSANKDVLIVTGDRDCYQLVSDPHVRVLYNLRGVSDYALYDEAGVLAKTGVTPAQYPDYAAMRGDPSDNLDGVPGIGEKTAAKLIAQYGDLTNIVAHADEQTPKLRTNLHEHGERVIRNSRIMVLRRDAPVEIDLDALAPRPDLAAARRLFEFLEFKTMAKRLSDTASTLGWQLRDSTPDATVESSAADVKIADARTTVASSPEQAVDAIVGSSPLCIAGRWHGAVARTPLTGVAVLSSSTTGEVMWIPAPLLSDPAVAESLSGHRHVHVHDAKPLMRSLLQIGIDLRGLTLDTAIAAYLINPSRDGYALSDVARDHLGVEMAENAGTGDVGLNFDTEPTTETTDAAMEVLVVAALSSVLRAEMKTQNIEALYDDIENPLVRVLARMEVAGIEVNRDTLTAIRDRLTQQTRELVVQLHTIAGGEFNLNSPVQLRKILYEDKGLTPGKKTKTGFSTDAATLEKLRDQWPEFIEPLLRYRELEKLRSTYGEGLLGEVQDDGRIHAFFNQTVARTGRLSSDHPNLHNIPIRSDEGRVFRDAFVPRSGCSLFVADYNQIELRCIAHLAQDPGLIGAFTAGEDIHRATAARVFGVKPSDVTHDQRSKAKMVSYGLAYGMEAYGLSQRLAIGVDEAATILNSYFAAFPKVKQYMDDTVVQARQRGYTETLFGRRRQIPELLSDNFRIRQAGERQAMNAAIQGLAADIFKIALVRLDSVLSEKGLASRIVLQVHDEIILEVPIAEKEEVESLALDVMRNAADLDVPLEVNHAWGDTWGSAKS